MAAVKVKAKSTAKKAKKSVAAKKPVRTTVAKKTAAKKTAAKPKAKRAAKSVNVAAKAESKVTSLFADFQDKAEQARATGKKAGLAYLGMYGTAYDFAKEQYQKAVEAQESRIDSLVKRGEAVQGSAKTRMDDIELPKMGTEAMKEMLQKRVDEAKDRAEDVADNAAAKFEELKGKIIPASA